MDIVINKRDDINILYKITERLGNEVVISGVNYRVKKLINIEDVEKVDDLKLYNEEMRNFSFLLTEKIRDKTCKGLIGTVLHVDADEEYIVKCLDLYKNVGVYAYPLLTKEEDMAQKLENISLEFVPDVIVLTGHDNFNGIEKRDLSSYLNSKHFADGVVVARKKYPNSIIIAGACQSLYEVLMARGANFASSPKRENIHVYDPAIIAINSCITSQKQIIDFYKMNKYIDNLDSAFGGIETYGKMKKVY